MKDSEFIKNDKVPMTKQEVRHISMGYLDIAKRKKLLDIGSGTGTISIEALMQNQDIKVTAIETDEKAYVTTVMNIESCEQKYKNIKNRIKLIKQKAPFELRDKFDAIFIGGTKGSVKQIINWSSKLLENNGVLVMNFITLENFYQALTAIEENCNLSYIEAVQVMINKIEKLAKYNYLKPQNPVFIIKCKRV